jgi:DNA-binding NtrC family response regulator
MRVFFFSWLIISCIFGGVTRKIYILDDDPAFLRSITAELKGTYEVVVAESVGRFRAQFAPHVFDLVVLDMRRRGREGAGVLDAQEQFGT